MRLQELNLKRLTDKTELVAANSLLTSVNEFAVLEWHASPQLAEEQHQKIIQQVQYAAGMAHSDAKHLTFANEKNYGMGIWAVLTKEMNSFARELEMQLTDSDEPGKVICARIQAYKEGPAEEQQAQWNYEGDAILYLANFGIYIRDLWDILAPISWKLYTSYTYQNSYGWDILQCQ